MTIPRYRPHYTIADYRQWEGDWELWNGIPVAMGPSPFGVHQKMLARLSQHFLNALDAQGCTECQLLIECDWIIGNDTIVRPDLSIVCGVETDRHIEQSPKLIVEVLSESTAKKDRTAKHDLYAAQGVTYYLLADPNDGQIEANALSEAGTYAPITDKEQANLKLHPTCSVSLASIRRSI